MKIHKNDIAKLVKQSLKDIETDKIKEKADENGEMVECKHCGNKEVYLKMRWNNGRELCRACYKEDYFKNTGKRYEWNDLD